MLNAHRIKYTCNRTHELSNVGSRERKGWLVESDTVVYICYRTATVTHIYYRYHTATVTHLYRYRTATVELIPLPYRYRSLTAFLKLNTTVTVRKSIGNWEHQQWDHTAESAVTRHRNLANK